MTTRATERPNDSRTEEPSENPNNAHGTNNSAQQAEKPDDEHHIDLGTRDNFGAQVGKARDVNVNNWFDKPPPTPAVDRMLAETTWQHVTNYFAERGGFTEARNTAEKHHLVFLRNEGNGREFAGVRMLIELGVKQIAHLNDRKSFDTVRSADLSPQYGYLWAGFDRHWQKSITPAAAHRLAEYACQAGAYIVVMLDDEMPLDAELRKFEEHLAPPDPVVVATCTLRAQYGYTAEEAELILEADFLEHLPQNTSPNRAEDVAIKAQEAYEDNRNRQQALDYLSRDLRDAVFDWFHHPERSSIEYAMLVAIAVFEHHDYSVVVASGKELERMIVEVDSEQQKTLRRRQIFEFSKAQLLTSLRANVAQRRHSDDLDLHGETVHFVRSAWAREAFRRVWDQYDLIRQVIVDWMAKHPLGSSQWYCAKALHDVTVNVAASNPLKHIHDLAGSTSRTANHLAVELLGRLAEDTRTNAAAERLLDDWSSRTDELHRKWTATRAYATEYGKYRPKQVLDQLERIAASDERDKLQEEVRSTVLALLDRPDNRALVLERLRGWTSPFRFGSADEAEKRRLRHVGLDCAQAALGLRGNTRYLRSLPSKPLNDAACDPDAPLVTTLFRRVFLDDRTARSALHALLDFGEYCRNNPDADVAKGLVQLINTVAPKLYKHTTHELFADWALRFPESAHRIHRLFETVRQLQYRHRTGNPDETTQTEHPEEVADH